MSEICILYCLIKREMTIYSIRKHITELFGAYTKPSHGTIHPALKKLAAENYVTVKTILSEGGKKSSLFSIAEKGKKLFAKLMLSDFSDNPSVSLNEINIRLAAMGALNSADKKTLTEICKKYLELYIARNEYVINDTYSGLDDYQKKIMLQTISYAKSLIKFTENLGV